MAVKASEYRTFVKNIKKTEWTALIKTTDIPESILEEKADTNTRQNWEAIIRYQDVSFKFIEKYIKEYSKTAFKNIIQFKHNVINDKFIMDNMDKFSFEQMAELQTFSVNLLSKLEDEIIKYTFNQKKLVEEYTYSKKTKIKSKIIEIIEKADFINNDPGRWFRKGYLLEKWRFTDQYVLDNFQAFKDYFKKNGGVNKRFFTEQDKNNSFEAFMRQYENNDQIQLLKEMS